MAYNQNGGQPPQPRDKPLPGGAPTAGSGTGVFVPTSFGGVLATRQAALYPCLNIRNRQTEYRTFDPMQGFNDPLLPSRYSWRVEQVKPYRQLTIRRVIWTFTDLGQVAATWTLTGVNDQQKVVSQSILLGVGNNPPTFRIMTMPVDISLTGMNMQLSVSRDANAGPLSVLSLLMVGEIEENTL